jgi:hypothetical protein
MITYLVKGLLRSEMEMNMPSRRCRTCGTSFWAKEVYWYFCYPCMLTSKYRDEGDPPKEITCRGCKETKVPEKHGSTMCSTCARRRREYRQKGIRVVK